MVQRVELVRGKTLSFYRIDLASGFFETNGEEGDTMGMTSKKNIYWASLLVGLSLVMGCAGHDHEHRDEPLPPPVYADAETAQAIKEGNRLFKERRW